MPTRDSRESEVLVLEEAGYSISEGVLSGDECERLAQALTDTQRPGRAGARHLMARPEVAELAVDARLLRLAAEALGGAATPYRATLFEKSGRANWLVVWHQDTALPLVARVEAGEWEPWSNKAGVL